MVQYPVDFSARGGEKGKGGRETIGIKFFMKELFVFPLLFLPDTLSTLSPNRYLTGITPIAPEWFSSLSPFRFPPISL